MSALPEPEPDLLDRLVTLLDAAAIDGGWYQPHLLVSLEGERLGVLPLELGQHPLEVLDDFVAAPTCDVLGAVCFGWAAPVGPTRPSQHAGRRRVRVVTLVDRTGDVRATATFDDGTTTDAAPTGAVAEALRVALGLRRRGGPPPHPA